MKKKIVLTTINSTYQHSSLGLRYLFANMGPLKPYTEICEFTLKKNPRDIAEVLLSKNPEIIGIGVYIWNARETLELVSILKKVSPQTYLVLGGPEISYETEAQELTLFADFIIKGEGDLRFSKLCQEILSQEKPAQKILSPTLPPIQELSWPYEHYSEEDIKSRILYVEASRGCPYRCEYCLSSLDSKVRAFPLDGFLAQIELLYLKGARSFKFIDRTFNLNIETCTQILQFFLSKQDPNLFLHFEMVPDRLPEEIKELIVLFPPGTLQFEIGVQTLNPQVAQNVSRKNNLKKVKENLEFLGTRTFVHTHVDLIAGLPGETLESFAQGFDELTQWGANEIQLGILKRLKGTPIQRHEMAFKLIYSSTPPFEILETQHLTFLELQGLQRFSKYWDLIANSGRFPHFIKELRSPTNKADMPPSFFWKFWNLSEYLHIQLGSQSHIALLNLTEWLYKYLQTHLLLNEDLAKSLILSDYSKNNKRDVPHFLRSERVPPEGCTEESRQQNSSNKRQKRHL